MKQHFLSGVLYAEDFDNAHPAVKEPEAPPPPEPVAVEPTFSLADLRRATSKAHEEARAQERRELQQGTAIRMTEAVARLADAVEQHGAEMGRIAAAAATATADMLLAMVATALPAYAAERGANEARSLLRLLLASMTHQPSLEIQAHPTLIDGLRAEVAGIVGHGKIVVDWIGCDSALPGDLTVRWKDGAMTRDTQALCAEVRALVMPEVA